jgi:hypothetical protein
MSNQTTADNGTCFKCSRPLGTVVMWVGSERFHQACAPVALLTPTEDDERIAREMAVEFDACFAGTPEQHAKIQDGLVKAIAQALAAKGARQREADALNMWALARLKGPFFGENVTTPLDGWNAYAMAVRAILQDVFKIEQPAAIRSQP